MIDAPGPWGTGPYTLVEGFSSLENEIGLIQAEPLTCVWLDTGTPRSGRVVLEANRDHWNSERGPRLERVVFRNELPPAEALELICGGEGEVDIVTEVSPADAQRVIASEHAKLVRVDAMRVLAGIVNWGAEGAPLHDVRARRASTWPSTGAGSSGGVRRLRRPAGRAHPALCGRGARGPAALPARPRPGPGPADHRGLAGRAELRLTAPADLEAGPAAGRGLHRLARSRGRPDPDPGRPAAGRPARPGREGVTPPSTCSSTPGSTSPRTRRRQFMHSQFFSGMGRRVGPLIPSSTNCWGGSPPPPTSGS